MKNTKIVHGYILEGFLTSYPKVMLYVLCRSGEK